MSERGPFDFATFRSAFEGKHVERWLACFAPDATWTEYRHANPPSDPNRMRGLGEIGAFLRAVSSADIRLAITHEVIRPERIAFRVTCTFADGRRVIEHVILEIRNGLIAEQTDVEAWDA